MYKYVQFITLQGQSDALNDLVQADIAMDNLMAQKGTNYRYSKPETMQYSKETGARTEATDRDQYELMGAADWVSWRVSKLVLDYDDPKQARLQAIKEWRDISSDPKAHGYEFEGSGETLHLYQKAGVFRFKDKKKYIDEKVSERGKNVKVNEKMKRPLRS